MSSAKSDENNSGDEKKEKQNVKKSNNEQETANITNTEPQRYQHQNTSLRLINIMRDASGLLKIWRINPYDNKYRKSRNSETDRKNYRSKNRNPCNNRVSKERHMCHNVTPVNELSRRPVSRLNGSFHATGFHNENLSNNVRRKKIPHLCLMYPQLKIMKNFEMENQTMLNSPKTIQDSFKLKNENKQNNTLIQRNPSDLQKQKTTLSDHNHSQSKTKHKNMNVQKSHEETSNDDTETSSDSEQIPRTTTNNFSNSRKVAIYDSECTFTYPDIIKDHDKASSKNSRMSRQNGKSDMLKSYNDRYLRLLHNNSTASILKENNTNSFISNSSSHILLLDNRYRNTSQPRNYQNTSQPSNYENASQPSNCQNTSQPSNYENASQPKSVTEKSNSETDKRSDE